jgi:SAM-dependent methyltransferase
MLATMALTPDELAIVSAQTLGHYERNARAFRDGTKDHDVTQNRAALLDALDGPGPFSILDLGCGPGRDLAYFQGLGHEAIGLDGCAAFVAMARAATGCEVYHQDFLALTLPPTRFDGMFANASLFHVPSQELARVLGELHAALRPRGVLFTSNPRGAQQEGWSGSRYSVHHDWDAWRGFVTGAGFTELHHYYRPPGRPRPEQPWLASVWRR